MGHVDAALRPSAMELPLPWGSVVRGVRWGAGPDRVLLLHEPGADIDAWGTLPAQLAQSLGVEALAIDLPGHGLSDNPWDPAMIAEVVRLLNSGPLAAAIASHPPSSVKPGEVNTSTQASEAERQFIIAAGSVASKILALAVELRLSGLVVLSPATVSESEPDASAVPPPAPGTKTDGAREAMAAIPKLFIAGSHAGDDLDTARRLASTSHGWTVVTSLPVPERGTSLFRTTWQTRLCEEITAFLRDCMHPTPAFLPPRPIAPQLPSQTDSR